jgi:hypothetical protein
MSWAGAGGRRRRTRIDGQFAPRLIEMLRSPAMAVLTLSARRILERIEIELAGHGGTDNGRLPVTFDDFVAFGIDRHLVAPATRELEVLGFIEITERGRAGNADWRKPNLFRLTFRDVNRAGPTHEWKQIKTLEEAKALAQAARKTPARKQNSSGGFYQTPVGETPTEKPSFIVAKPPLQGIVAKPPLLSISRVRDDTSRALVSQAPAPPPVGLQTPSSADEGRTTPAKAPSTRRRRRL